MKNFKLVLAIFYLLILCSCSPYLTKKQVVKYSDYTLEEFIEKRFIVGDSFGKKFIAQPIEFIFLDIYGKGMATVSEKNEKSYNKLKNEEKIAKELYLYNGHYTGTNNKSLMKPKKDLDLFCSNKGGKLLINKVFKKDIVSKNYSSPEQVYLESLKYDKEIKTKMFITDDISIPLLIDKNQIALTKAQFVRDDNIRLDKVGAIYGYQDAILENSFGEFYCVKQENNKILWGVNILPIGFKSKEVNGSISSSSHTLYMRIIPIVNKN